jgi:hypothetical protein
MDGMLRMQLKVPIGHQRTFDPGSVLLGFLGAFGVLGGSPFTAFHPRCG